MIVNLNGEKESLNFFLNFIESFFGIRLKTDKSVIKASEYEDGDILIL